ncbi:MAG TPA: biopolymer transporter ExbD [Crinalium sp.]|jgi:biopolymer transport protein ExbD
MKIHSDHHSIEQDVRIELIPLIDVIFCILTFFILAAVAITRQTAINIDLPQASTGSVQMRDMLIVSVDPVGQIYIDKQAVTRDELYRALLDYQQKKPQGMMVLYASRLSSYNDVVQVLDLLRSVGGDRVALATLPDAGSAQSGTAQPGTLPNSNQPQLPGTTPDLGTQTNPFAPSAPSNTNPFGSPSTTDPFNTNPSGQPLPSSSPLPNSGITPPPATTP